MSKYELVGWEDELHISLIGLYSIWSDFQVAYYLNKNLTTCLKNNPEGFELNTKANQGKYSYYFGELEYNPLYLITNRSYSAHNQVGPGLFAEQDLNIDQFFLKSMSRWPYLLLTTTPQPIEHWNPLSGINTISSHVVDYKHLNKYEQKILNEFTYAE